MRELLVLVVLLPVALVVVLNQELATVRESAPSPTPVTIRVAAPTPTTAPAPAFAGDLVAAAKSWLGVPYRWGGCTRSGTDCSCYVRNVLLTIGINAPRTTVEQVRWAQPVGRGDLRIGDLLFFDSTCTDCGANPTHVGIYLGVGVMAEAGDPVQLANVDAPFWRSHYASAGRPPGL
jgi:cell wall-associated NlpC family hydrolase